MATEIKDGGGTGRLAIVTADAQLRTLAETISELAFVSVNKKKAFYISTDLVALTTTGAFSGVLFFLNPSQIAYRIHQLETCGDVVQAWKLIKNPTAGTLVSAGTTITPENLDSGSPIDLAANAKLGADGLLLDNGVLWTQWINDIGKVDLKLGGAVIIQPGDSFALMSKPVTAGNVCATVLLTSEG